MSHEDHLFEAVGLIEKLTAVIENLCGSALVQKAKLQRSEDVIKYMSAIIKQDSAQLSKLGVVLKQLKTVDQYKKEISSIYPNVDALLAQVAGRIPVWLGVDHTKAPVTHSAVPEHVIKALPRFSDGNSEVSTLDEDESVSVEAIHVELLEEIGEEESTASDEEEAALSHTSVPEPKESSTTEDTASAAEQSGEPEVSQKPTLVRAKPRLEKTVEDEALDLLRELQKQKEARSPRGEVHSHSTEPQTETKKSLRAKAGPQAKSKNQPTKEDRTERSKPAAIAASLLEKSKMTAKKVGGSMQKMQKKIFVRKNMNDDEEEDKTAQANANLEAALHAAAADSSPDKREDASPEPPSELSVAKKRDKSRLSQKLSSMGNQIKKEFKNMRTVDEGDSTESDEMDIQIIPTSVKHVATVDKEEAKNVEPDQLVDKVENAVDNVALQNAEHGQDLHVDRIEFSEAYNPDE